MMFNTLFQISIKEILRMLFLILVPISVWAESSLFKSTSLWITSDILRNALSSVPEKTHFYSGSSAEVQLIPGNDNQGTLFYLEFKDDVYMYTDPDESGVSIVHRYNNGRYPTNVTVTTDHPVRLYYDGKNGMLVEPKNDIPPVESQFLSKDEFLELNKKNHFVITSSKQKHSLNLSEFSTYSSDFPVAPQVYKMYMMRTQSGSGNGDGPRKPDKPSGSGSSASGAASKTEICKRHKTPLELTPFDALMLALGDLRPEVFDAVYQRLFATPQMREAFDRSYGSGVPDSFYVFIQICEASNSIEREYYFNTYRELGLGFRELFFQLMAKMSRSRDKSDKEPGGHR